LGDKRDLANQVHASTKKLAAKGSAEVAITMRLKVIDVPPRGTASSGPGLGLPKGGITPAVSASVSLDYRRHRVLAALPATDPGQPPVPFQYFSEAAVYQRRLGSTNGARPWLKFDFASHYDQRKDKAQSGFADNLFNPAWVVDLLNGALAGSIKLVGSEDLGGVKTSHYKVNFDWEKALKTQDNVRRRPLETALVVMGVPQRVVKGEVWLDADGVPRRIKANIRQVKDRKDIVELQLALEFSNVGVPFDIRLPKKKEISVVDNVGSLRQPVATAAPTAGTPAP
jgi:hypothetical protein